jgi:hypothetical protein
MRTNRKRIMKKFAGLKAINPTVTKKTANGK